MFFYFGCILYGDNEYSIYVVCDIGLGNVCICLCIDKVLVKVVGE